jgi:predicted XRE-type DNA-binding protein
VERLLKKYNLSQKDLQRLTYIQQARISDWITGKHAISNISCFALDRVEQLLKERYGK